MISLFNQPISSVHETRGPLMVLGVSETGDALVVNVEGFMGLVPVTEVRVDWRYDWRLATWIDVGPYEDADADEEATDAWGEEVQGDLPDVDGADGSGEGDGEDRAPGRVDSGAEEGAGSQ